MGSHPAGVGAASYWFGLEVEGYLARRAPMTMFLACDLSAEELTHATARCQELRVQHLFLTEDFEAWDWFGEHMLPHLSPFMPISVARRSGSGSHAVEKVLAMPYADRLALIVHVMPTPWIHKLRKQDQVILGVPYHLRTFCVADGVLTVPDQYKGDVE